MANSMKSGGRRLHLLNVANRDDLVLAVMLISFAFVTFGGVHGIIAPAAAPPPPKIPVYHQFEADALHAILKNWSTNTPQLVRVLKWSLNKHPCTGSNLDFFSGGAWGGVYCDPSLLMQNTTGIYYQVSITGLMLYGSHSRCRRNEYLQCGFDGINGVLPSEISQLINLQIIWISNHPQLTGPIPLEIWQMPNLTTVFLENNSLIGPLSSNVHVENSKITQIYMSNNNLSGRVEVSPQGTFFSAALMQINVSNNQLDGPVNFETLNNDGTTRYLWSVDLSNNCLKGTFSTGPYFNPHYLSLANNAFTAIEFANYSGPGRGPGPVYMPSLTKLYVGNNKLSGLFPEEIRQMPSLQYLDLHGNNFSGSVDFRAITTNSWITQIKSLDLSRNNFLGLMDFRGTQELELKKLVVNHNYFNGTFFTGSYLDPWEVDLSFNNFNNINFEHYNGTMPQSGNGYMPSLKTLDIQNNNLSGDFPAQILQGSSLQKLYGGQNLYKGTLILPNISIENLDLSILSLTDNSFDYILYPSLGRFSTSSLQFSNILFLDGNPICNKIETTVLSTVCRYNQSSLPRPITSMSDTKNKVIIAASISTTFAFILLVIGLYVWRLMGRIKSLGVILGEFDKKDVKPNLYSYKEIKLATKNFDKKNKLGEGGFGVVYKGELFDGTIVAVKKLTLSSNQMLPEFLNEVVVISGLRHRNLVKLKGCCLGDGDQRMLVFEYVENKNLAEALFIQDGLTKTLEVPYMDWTTRFNIIIGTARGLAYLHNDLQSPVIHRDIKASNILLDKNFNPKIADFGLAYLFPTLNNEETHLTLLQVAGTRGYCSPEYALHGHISTALDVYSFGILILEIVSGRKCIDLQKSSDEIYVREWAWKQFEVQSLITLIDPTMKHSSIELEIIMRVISVALACVHYKAAMRPKMHDVVSMLLGKMPINDFLNMGRRLKMNHDTSTFGGTFGTTSSFWKKEKIPVDECWLLNNASEIELNSMA